MTMHKEKFHMMQRTWDCVDFNGLQLGLQLLLVKVDYCSVNIFLICEIGPRETILLNTTRITRVFIPSRWHFEKLSHQYSAGRPGEQTSERGRKSTPWGARGVRGRSSACRNDTEKSKRKTRSIRRPDLVTWKLKLNQTTKHSRQARAVPTFDAERQQKSPALNFKRAICPTICFLDFVRCSHL